MFSAEDVAIPIVALQGENEQPVRHELRAHLGKDAGKVADVGQHVRCRDQVTGIRQFTQRLRHVAHDQVVIDILIARAFDHGRRQVHPAEPEGTFSQC